MKSNEIIEVNRFLKLLSGGVADVGSTPSMTCRAHFFPRSVQSSTTPPTIVLHPFAAAVFVSMIIIEFHFWQKN